jgi:hypothetical protein
MGNSQALDSFQKGLHSRIPADMAPPASQKILDQSKHIAEEYYTHHNPTSVHKCKECHKEAPNVTQRKLQVQKATKIRNFISTFGDQDRPYSERNFVFLSPGNDSHLFVSSTKNSDHTISYWVQYPVLDFHIKMAFLKLMNINVTYENMAEVLKRYPAVFFQCKKQLEGHTVKCEQIDALYMDNIIKSLLFKNYQVAKVNK